MTPLFLSALIRWHNFWRQVIISSLDFPKTVEQIGFDKLVYPHYGGFITIPHQGTAQNPHDFIIMHFQNNTWRLPSPPHCVVRTFLETAQSAQGIPADTFNNLPLNWDKECDSIFSERNNVRFKFSLRANFR
jgi:hypothetical protein